MSVEGGHGGGHGGPEPIMPDNEAQKNVKKTVASILEVLLFISIIKEFTGNPHHNEEGGHGGGH